MRCRKERRCPWVCRWFGCRLPPHRLESLRLCLRRSRRPWLKKGWRVKEERGNRLGGSGHGVAGGEREIHALRLVAHAEGERDGPADFPRGVLQAGVLHRWLIGITAARGELADLRVRRARRFRPVRGKVRISR